MDFLIPVLTGAQMRECDAFTIANEPISSLDLMERASRSMYNLLKPGISKKDKIAIFCGPGNNGGDGLCMARMMLWDGFDVTVYRCIFDKKASADHQKNYELLHGFRPHAIKQVKDVAHIDLSKYTLIIDALFGTGLTQELNGDFKSVIEKLNASDKRTVALDLPSGLFDIAAQKAAPFVHATETIAIETPKPSFFYAENKIVFRIAKALINTSKSNSDISYLSPELPWRSHILEAFPHKPVFGHKGNSGHVLLVGGNNGMHGAIALAAESCIAHGAGLTTVFAPAGARLYLGSIPKTMHLPKKILAENVDAIDMEKYSVLCIGPGLGTETTSHDFLKALLKKWNHPVILDADALNLLALHPALWKLVKPGSVITPHPGEFQRLFGTFSHVTEKLELARKVAAEKNIFILAKDKYSALVCPDGNVIYNGSGGPDLAQGGSGDILAGAVAAWLARTNDPKMAGMAAMYLCGLKEYLV